MNNLKNENNLKTILDDEMYLKAKNKALNILSKADQSEKKIREKLYDDFEESTIDKVIEFLKRNKFIEKSNYMRFFNIIDGIYINLRS